MHEIVNYISLFWERFRNVADICVVAFLIYWLYTFLNKTKAIMIVKGLSVIFILAIGSEFLRLETLRWLTTNFTSSIIIIVIVLFQPELRRMVMHFGRRGWFSGSGNKSLHLDELVTALYSMSKENVGALIVVERSTGLRNFVESGVAINAKISEELIRTIFHPSTLLHDGAIIIQDGIISAAACYLPLSDSKQLKKHHGSRHRAALGISEETDAMTLVVSEETGAVSLVVNGNMYSRLKENELKNMILFYLNPKTAHREYQIKK